jgi:hypothetical protein
MKPRWRWSVEVNLAGEEHGLIVAVRNMFTGEVFVVETQSDDENTLIAAVRQGIMATTGWESV